MIAVLGLESIGDDAARVRGAGACVVRDLGRQVRREARYAERPRPWVARIVGADPQYGFAREFVRPKKDYAEAGGTGSRGVFLWYELPEGVYEVNAPQSWKRTDRYFARSERGRLAHMTRREVVRWIESGA